MKHIYGRVHRYIGTVYLRSSGFLNMISPIIKAVDPICSLVTSAIALPWVVWDWVKDIMRRTVAMNGYTAIYPDGVLMKNKDSEDEGESKED